jgi:hypothetical protein
VPRFVWRASSSKLKFNCAVSHFLIGSCEPIRLSSFLDQRTGIGRLRRLGVPQSVASPRSAVAASPRNFHQGDSAQSRSQCTTSSLVLQHGIGDRSRVECLRSALERKPMPLQLSTSDPSASMRAVSLEGKPWHPKPGFSLLCGLVTSRRNASRFTAAAGPPAASWLSQARIARTLASSKLPLTFGCAQRATKALEPVILADSPNAG